MADKTVQSGKSKPSLSLGLGLGLSLEDKIELSIELARIALGCKGCSEQFKKVIEDYSHQGGLTASNSQTKEDYNNESTSS